MKKNNKKYEEERNKIFSQIHRHITGGMKVNDACAKFGVKAPSNYYSWKKRTLIARVEHLVNREPACEITFKFTEGTVVITTRKDLCIKAMQLLVSA